MNNPSRLLTILGAALTIAAPIASLAQNSPQPNDISSASSKYSSTSVFVGGTPIMRVRFGASGYTPEQRAAVIQDRVNNILSQGAILPADISVQDLDRNDSAVYVKGKLLFTADAGTAKYNTTTAHALAMKWANTMRQVLPELTQAK